MQPKIVDIENKSAKCPICKKVLIYSLSHPTKADGELTHCEHLLYWYSFGLSEMCLDPHKLYESLEQFRDNLLKVSIDDTLDTHEMLAQLLNRNSDIHTRIFEDGSTGGCCDGGGEVRDYAAFSKVPVHAG